MATVNSSKTSLKFRLQEMRLNGEYTDVAILCKDSIALEVHSLILISASDELELEIGNSSETTIKKNERKRKINTMGVVRVDFESKTMATLLDFVYLENDAVIEFDNLDRADALLRAAFKFAMKPLLVACARPAEKLLVTAHHIHYAAKWLQSYAGEYTRVFLDFVKKFWREILGQDLHLQYNIKLFTTLLECLPTSVFANDDYGYVVFKILQWVRSDKDKRSYHTAFLISEVFIKHLDKDAIRILLDNEIVKTNCDVLLMISNELETRI